MTTQLHHPPLPEGVPLVLKASCDERIKRIRFSDSSTLQYDHFQSRIAGSLQFEDVDFSITWEDDDGEHVSLTVMRSWRGGQVFPLDDE
jgi:hypothetical protein